MKTYIDCVPCFVKQALKAARVSTPDTELQKEALRQAIIELAGLDFNQKPPVIARHVYKTIERVTGNRDPCKEIKKRDNEKALGILPKVIEKVNSFHEPFLAAVKAAIAGNIMDFGACSDYDIKKTIDSVLKKDFKINHFNQFMKDIKKASTISYLADNAGEIVFDRLLVEKIREHSDCKICFFVKKKPVINDATHEDAAFAGLEKINRLEIKTVWERDSRDFLNSLEKSDLVISKGQGNYEALSEINANIYFLLIAKCPVVARDLKVGVGDTVLKSAGGRKK